MLETLIYMEMATLGRKINLFLRIAICNRKFDVWTL